MNKPVEITNGEWAQVTNNLQNNTREIIEHEDRLNRHSKEINALKQETSKLPYAIEKAVASGMEKVLTKVLEHDRKFQSLETQKIEQRAIKAEKELEAQKERKRYYRKIITQAIIGCFITSVVGGILSFYVAVFLNNL